MRNPKKLTAAMIDRLCKAVGDGLPDKYAAHASGISPRTLKNWRASAKTAAPKSNLARLDRELARADAEFIRHHMAKIAEAKSGSWQASAWLLERKFQDYFALVQRIETGEVGDFAKLTDKELNAAILDLVPRRARAPGAVTTTAKFTTKPKAPA